MSEVLEAATDGVRAIIEQVVERYRAKAETAYREGYEAGRYFADNARPHPAAKVWMDKCGALEDALKLADKTNSELHQRMVMETHQREGVTRAERAMERRSTTGHGPAYSRASRASSQASTSGRFQ